MKDREKIRRRKDGPEISRGSARECNEGIFVLLQGDTGRVKHLSSDGQHLGVIDGLEL